VERLERDIDTVCEELPALTHFVLPRGCPLAGQLHLARTVARRAERAVVAALQPDGRSAPAAAGALRYLNRLSDLLFALARLANRDSGEGDATWAP
jgi:cob(I)alamin adenosyltransferase